MGGSESYSKRGVNAIVQKAKLGISNGLPNKWEARLEANGEMAPGRRRLTPKQKETRQLEGEFAIATKLAGENS